MNYPVLSCSPPYGSLIALLLKKIETRGWATAHRGSLLIHQTAAPGPKGTTEAALWELCATEPFRSALASMGITSASQLPRGKIVALVELVGVVPVGSVQRRTLNDWPRTDQEKAFGDYSPGRHAWLLANVRPLPEPIAARGLPGLWRWEGDIGL